MEELNIDGMLDEGNVVRIVPKEKPQFSSARAQEMYENSQRNAAKLAKAKSFISDDYIKVTPNTAILIAAPSGRGKTTALYSAVTHELKRGGKVIFFTNEMGYQSVDAKVLKVLSAQLGISLIEAANSFASSFIVYHSSRHPELSAFDRAYDFIYRKTVEHKADLVVFDQMSNMKKHSKTGERPDPWKAMPEFTENFVHWQEAGKEELPPIVLIQQANTTSKKEVANLQASLRGSKGTIADVAVGILIVRNADSTTFVLDKARTDENVVLDSASFETTMVFEHGVYKPLVSALGNSASEEDE
jgi:hypothetical protein